MLKFFDKAAHREQRLFRRYFGEARAQRKKALGPGAPSIETKIKIPETNSICNL